MNTGSATSLHDKIHAEELTAGQVYELGQYTLTESEIIEFATAWDPQPFHIDRAHARDGFFGGLIASGIHTMAIYQRLCALGPYRGWAVIAGRGISELQLPAPVRPGDTLAGISTIESIQYRRGHRALVTIAGRLANQDGVEVLSLTMASYIRARSDDQAP